MKYAARFIIGAVIGLFVARADDFYSKGEAKIGRAHMILAVVCAFIGGLVIAWVT